MGRDIYRSVYPVSNVSACSSSVFADMDSG